MATTKFFAVKRETEKHTFNDSLVALQKILLELLHIELVLEKQLVKAMNNSENALCIGNNNFLGWVMLKLMREILKDYLLTKS